MNEEMYDTLKREVFMNGIDAINDFLGFEIVDWEKDTIEKAMDEVLEQMPEEEALRFYHKYVEQEVVTAGLLRELIGDRNIPGLLSLIKGKADDQPLDLLDRNDYAAIRLFGDEDIACCLQEEGYASTVSNIAKIIDSGYMSRLEDSDDEDWDVVYHAIESCKDGLEREAKICPICGEQYEVVDDYGCCRKCHEEMMVEESVTIKRAVETLKKAER